MSQPAPHNDCGEFWNSVFLTPVLRGAFLIRPNFTYKPDIISKFKLQQSPMRITYYIRGNAHWSDKVPVSGKDFIFSWKAIMSAALRITSRRPDTTRSRASPEQAKS